MKLFKNNTKILLIMAAMLVVGIYTVYAATGAHDRLIGNRTYSTIATGAAAIDFELAPTKTAEIREIRINLSIDAANAELLTIALDSGNGAVYDAIYTSSTTAIGTADTTYWVVYDPPFVVGPDDELDINWPNTATATWGLEVIYNLR